MHSFHIIIMFLLKNLHLLPFLLIFFCVTVDIVWLQVKEDVELELLIAELPRS